MKTEMKPVLGHLLSALVAGIAVSLLSATPAFAQATTDQTDQGPVKLERIQVTGSNIRRSDLETPSPVQVLSADDLKNSGYTTVADVLQHITANGQGTLSQGFNGAFAGGASGVSIRGLTTAYTLVLIDGHRMPCYPLYDDSQRCFVDVSNIPFDIVDRVEVLKDGASAVYGSDAIAAVVNIILKHNFQGATVTAEQAWTTEGGGQTQHISALGGIGNLDTDGYNAYFNVEYRHQDPIYVTQRLNKGQWSQIDWQSEGGNTKQPGILSPQNGITQPPTLSPYLTPNNQSGPLSASNSIFFPGTACSSFAQLSAGGCAFISPLAEIEPRTQNLNITGSVTKKLGENWTGKLTASWWDSQSQQYPSYFPNTGLNGFPSSFSGNIAVSAGVNPHIVGTPISQITVPANYPGNTFGVPAVVNGIMPQIAPANYQYDAQTSRIAGDLNGTVGAWDIVASAGYSKITVTNTANGFLNIPQLNSDLQNDTYNILGGNSAAVLSGIAPSQSVNDWSDLYYGEFHATRPIYKLPGGDMSISLGGEYLYKETQSPSEPLFAAGIVSGSVAYTSGKQTDEGLYAELAAPVMKNLELDLSVRGDHFDNSSGAVVPKGGFKWTATEWVAFRGTLGQGFRAPNAAENGQSGNAFLAPTENDPVLCPGGIPASGNIAKGSVVGFCSFQPAFLNESSPGLSPEKSTSGTLGMLLEPVKGWATDVEFYDIDIRNQIILGPASPNPVRGAPVQALCADGNGGTYTCTTPVGPILYYPDSYINANSVKTYGIDFDTQYKWKLGNMGSLKTELMWSHALSYTLTTGGMSYQLVGTHGPFVIGGDTANPRDRVQGAFTWDRGPAHVTMIVNWISGYNLLDPSIGFTSCAISGANGNGWWPAGNIPSNFCSVKSFTEVDLVGSYNITKHWQVHAGATNLFNAQPPVDMNTYGGAFLPYNPSMHQPGAIGRLLTVGAKYTF